MKHVVVVSDILFWKASYGSHARIRQLIRHLAATHKVTVFFLRTVGKTLQQEFAELGIQNASIVSYKAYSGRQPVYSRVLSKDEYFKGKEVVDFTASLHGFLKEKPADAVIFEYLKLAYMKDACPSGVATILDMHDVMSARTVSMRQAGLKASIEMDAAAEFRILRHFDQLLAISRADVDHARSVLGLRNVLYAPYTVKARLREEFGEGRKLIMVGANSAPNVTGLQWFLSQVWPLLSPGYQLDVVGSIRDSFVGENMPPLPENVVFHGEQTDLDGFHGRADIAINPVYVGGGLKIKCVDALAAGLPCVTTREGAAGLEEARLAGLVVANSRGEFALAIERLAASAKHRRAAAESSWRFMNNAFSMQAAHAELDAYLAGPEEAPGAAA